MMMSLLMKTFLPFLFLGFVNEGEGGIDDLEGLLNKEVESGAGGGNPAAPVKPAEKAPEPTPEDKKKAEEAAAAEAKAKEDEEFDLKDLGKLKKSELKELLDKGRDYTKKTQDLSEKELKIKELSDWGEIIKGNEKAVKFLVAFSEKLVKEGGEYNEELLDNLMASFEAKKEAAKENIEGQVDDIDEALKDLDPDSSLYKAMKAQKEQLKALQDKIDKQTNVFKEKETAETQAKQKEAHEALVKKATETYNNTLEAISGPESKDGIKFEDDHSKKMWRSLVSSVMKDQAKDYKTEDEFVSHLKEVGKACYAVLAKYEEAVLARHLKSKSLPKPKDSADSGAEGNKKPVKQVSGSLQESIEAALAEEAAGSPAS